jgi:hypothetical protein
MGTGKRLTGVNLKGEEIEKQQETEIKMIIYSACNEPATLPSTLSG